MSLLAYEDACLRAELFGSPKPNKEEFLEKNKHLDIIEVTEDDVKNAESENAAMIDEKLAGSSGGLSELNSILGSTQTKINRLKGMCGNITNILKIKFTGSKENISQTKSNDGEYVDISLSPTPSAEARRDIATANEDLKAMQRLENTPVAGKASAKDMTDQVNSQIDKLDRLLSMADRAQGSMQHQNKQMRSILK